MIINGKEIANDIKEKLKKEVGDRKMPPKLVIVSVGENFVSEKFLAVKKKFAGDIGVFVEEKKFNEGISTEEIVAGIKDLARENSGIIVQLPLPKSIDTQRVLNTIPPTHDADVLSAESFALYEKGELAILPPVVGAIKEILLRHNVFVGNKNVVIVGKGKLVGTPAAIWFLRHQSSVEGIDEHTPNSKRYTLNADIIVLGAGSPHFLKPDMVKEGVVILDAGTSTGLSAGTSTGLSAGTSTGLSAGTSTGLSAGTSTGLSAGTSESGGKLQGDADPACTQKASLFTPVPGGIGPVTVAMLFSNLLELTKK